MEGFQPPRNLLFSVFTAEIQCFLRFHEVRRGMLFGMNFRLFFFACFEYFDCQKLTILNDFSSTATGCIVRTSSTLRAPADPFARSAVSLQRSLLAAQFSRSAVSVLPSKPGRAQGWAKGPCKRPRAKGPKGPKGPLGPLGQGALRGPGPLRGPGGPLIRKKCYP